MNQFSRLTAFLVLVPLIVAGCDGFGGGISTCDIQKPPLIEIREAEAEQSGNSIPVLSLTDFAVNGNAVNLQYPGLDEGSNIEVKGDTLHCTVPCSFGREQGSYGFTVSAPEFASKRLNFDDVSYTNREEVGGCPRIIYSGSQEISISLTQAQDAP
jgi:hypothetical protein